MSCIYRRIEKALDQGHGVMLWLDHPFVELYERVRILTKENFWFSRKDENEFYECCFYFPSVSIAVFAMKDYDKRIGLEIKQMEIIRND